MCEDERPLDPEEFDPFARDGQEFFSVAGSDGNVVSEPEPNHDEIERLALLKVCKECSEKEGANVFMDVIEGTAADIYQSPLEDSVDVRTWAVCSKCRRVRLIS